MSSSSVRPSETTTTTLNGRIIMRPPAGRPVRHAGTDRRTVRIGDPRRSRSVLRADGGKSQQPLTELSRGGRSSLPRRHARVHCLPDDDRSLATAATSPPSSPPNSSFADRVLPAMRNAPSPILRVTELIMKTRKTRERRTSSGVAVAFRRLAGRRTSALGQLSLASLRGRLIEYQLRLG